MSERFAAYIRWAEGLPTWLRVVAVVGVTASMAGAAWDERGAAMGLAAAGFFAMFFGASVRRGEPLGGRLRAHPLLDGSLLAPVTFFAAAILTDRSLAACAVAGVVAGAALLAVRVSSAAARDGRGSR